jgi:hypothetical protein
MCVARHILPRGRDPEAAAEFQKILDHRGIVASDPIGAVARFELGRALVSSGDKTKKPKQPTRISSSYGRTPIRTSRFFSKRKRNTPGCLEQPRIGS